MQGKVFLTSTGYDPALGREVRDPTLEGAMSGDASDVVAELDAELALIEQLPYRVPIHLLAKRARDEIVALREIAARPSSELHTLTKERDEARAEIVGLRGLLEHSDRTVITAVAVATPAIRDEALEEAAQVCDRLGLGVLDDGAAAIRALKNKAEPQS